MGELCRLKPHVLRYWEQEFSQLSPPKRRGNRRYYRKQDIQLIRDIRSLLYAQGFTIQGARLQLSGKREEPPAAAPTNNASNSIAAIRSELESILKILAD